MQTMKAQAMGNGGESRPISSEIYSNSPTVLDKNSLRDPLKIGMVPVALKVEAAKKKGKVKKGASNSKKKDNDD